MAFIKTQKVVYDDFGKIISGSAAIVDTIYGNYGSYHAKHTVRERLGRVIFLSEDKKSGIFMSPTRGLVEYDAVLDTFSEVDKDDVRLSGTGTFPQTEIHTVFGDVYLLLKFFEKVGLIAVLRDVFPKKQDYERAMVHMLHGIIRDSSRITCDSFFMKSFASYVFPDIPEASLKCDTRFFSMMGQDHTKLAFFRAFVSMMRKADPAFGTGCYVDSTPLPNDIEDNPFNALCCHGVSSSEVMTRLILVLDEETGLPVWYDIIPGNVVDMNTIMTTINDVADSLDIEIESLVLDAGYVSRELIEAFHIGTDKTVIGRMPARKGYPYKELYWEVKKLIGKGKYEFIRRHHAYFGKKKQVELFGHKEYAYVYVDRYNALKKFSNYLVEHEEEYREMKQCDQDWYLVKYGYFVLISNIDTTPEELLSEYFGRTEIESVIKTSKEYLDLLPLSKWTDETVRGKILHDIMDTIALLLLRKAMRDTGYSTTEIFGKAQSLMCCRNAASGMITVETPNKYVKKYYKLLGLEVPAHVKDKDFMKHVLGLKM